MIQALSDSGVRPVRRDLEHVAGCLAGGFGGVDLSRAAVRIPTTPTGVERSRFFDFLVLTGCDLKPGGELFFGCRLFFGSGPLVLSWCGSGVVVMFAAAHLFCQCCCSGGYQDRAYCEGGGHHGGEYGLAGCAMGAEDSYDDDDCDCRYQCGAGAGDSDCPTVIFPDVGFLCTSGVGCILGLFRNP